MLKDRRKNSKAKSEKKVHANYFKKFSIAFFVCILSYGATTLLLHGQASKPACANSKSCSSDLSLKVENNIPGYFQRKKFLPPIINSPEEAPAKPVLGAQTLIGEKHIYVDLSTQTIYAYQGSTLILKTLASTGKWNKTPTGNFHIWEKLRATRMTGGEGDDAYDLPNVPYVMYFYSDFGLHGAYWHDNFGHTMSHGCVNLREVDAKTLFEWADGPNGNTQGTAVSVCNQVTNNHQCIQNNPIQ